MVKPSAGGLATGLNSLQTDLEKHWIGWPGIFLEDRAKKKEIEDKLAGLNFHPVNLSVKQIDNYYKGYSNSVLWPLFHYFFGNVRSRDSYWNTYKEVNGLFLEKALEVIEPGDIVWVQDYHLMLLPQMIREKMPDVCIGYFHHIPFPSYELFRTLPERVDILNGLLGADLIGFHIHSYVYHFINATRRILKLDSLLSEVYSGNRIAFIDAFPMGINYEMYHDAVLSPGVQEKADKFKKDFGDSKVILSVDRLDYSKGILMRLKCFDTFLTNNPGYRGAVSHVMIVSPSRDEVEKYASLKKEIDRKVGAINGKFSTAGWQAVYYFYRTFGFEELCALYHMADIAWVTSFRDGMNLVAKEYIAAKRDGKGMLILSELAGAAIELSDAIVVNPTNIREMENAIVQALNTSEEEQRETLKNMQEIIRSQDVGQWAKDFIEELTSVNKRNEKLRNKILSASSFLQIKQDYDRAKKRLIVLDYDGTLSPFYAHPAKAYPTAEILDILRKIKSDPSNTLIINSGRDRSTLDNWFGQLSIGLAAEHGAFYKENGVWHTKVQQIEWPEEIVRLLKYTLKETPNSRLEIKETALVWHYRNVDIWLAELRVSQLINELNILCPRQNLQLMKGNKILEIKPIEFSKGKEVLRLMEQDNYDFIMAIGDDTTDEEMFAVLPADGVSVKIGAISRAARFNLPYQQQTIPFLSMLIN